MNNKSEFIIVNGVLKSYNGFSQDVIIPDGVTEIGFKAFMDCENITNVTIPEGVEQIDDSAFCGCKNLTEIIKALRLLSKNLENKAFSRVSFCLESDFGANLVPIVF